MHARFVLIVSISIVVAGACGAEEPVITPAPEPFESQNSLSSNGIFQNGIFQNGIFQNGLFQRETFENGRSGNGVFQDGLLQDGLWRDEVWQRNPAALSVLRGNPYARQVLQYIYQCAMPASSSPDPQVRLDPAGANVELRGQIGLAPQWGQPGGTCDQSCQRWVSACVLARTNAYGVPVAISMRVPDLPSVPPHIRAALAVTASEASQFTLREGAFYGNLFQTTAQPDGPAIGEPVFNACAGPGSNIPNLTRRFCSSQGAGGPITVAGACEPRPGVPDGVCEGIHAPAVDASNPPAGPGKALYNCATASGTVYSEVITVYLRQPLAVCGDSVCDEAGGETESSCPGDCHPGWARTLPLELNDIEPFVTPSNMSVNETSALAPDGSSILLGASSSRIELGCESVPGPGCVSLDPGPGAAGDQLGILVKYDPNGDYAWVRRFGPFPVPPTISGAVVGSDGSIIVSGNLIHYGYKVWIAKLDASGHTSWMVTSGGTNFAVTKLAPVVDGQGNVFVAGYFLATVTFGATTLTSRGDFDAFVAKISPSGVPSWAVRLGEPQHDSPGGLAVDLHGDVLLSLYTESLPTADRREGLLKLCGGASCPPGKVAGDVLWQRRGRHQAVTTDAIGNVYATGSLAGPALYAGLPPNTYDFPLPAGAGKDDFFVVKYGGDGAFHRVHTIPMTPDGSPGRFDGMAIAFDVEGNVIVGIKGKDDSPIHFGAVVLDSYGTEDVFVTSFSPDLVHLQWVKHVPMVLYGMRRSMAVDRARGRVVMSGTYTGSTQIDDRLLVNDIPELDNHQNTFIASFAIPSPSLDPDPPTMSHVPSPMVVQATSPGGAEVFFMPPTAIEGGDAGATVACHPAPSSTFPIGTTQVRCIASDPLGHQSCDPSAPSCTHPWATFPVTVADTLGPTFAGVPPAITREATAPAGDTVVFAPPTARDLVDGPRVVTCSHASGAVFPLGTTQVQCFASDTTGHETRTSFGVTILDTTPPLLAIPETVFATATSTSGAVVSYAATAGDLVDGPVPVSCTHPSGSLFPLGGTSVTCSATDARGNTVARKLLVAVRYTWSNLLSPIDPSGTSRFPLGGPISVRFRLTGASSSVTNAKPTLSLIKLSPNPTGAVIAATPADSGNTGNRFRYDASSGEYIYNLSTAPLAVGTWSLRIDLGEGGARTVPISLTP
jgi:hypothetical protein